MTKIAHLRTEYSKHALDIDSTPDNPIAFFSAWFKEALETGGMEVNAFVLSTVNAQNKPSARVVLIKEITKNGLIFFTNYLSNKGKELEQNPHVSATFFWPHLERQVRLQGIAKKISEESSTEYFISRPRESQAGAIVSSQSARIESKQSIEEKMANMLKNPEPAHFEKPEHWGGYEIQVDYVEFWQGRPGRLHDRVAYEKLAENWNKFLMAP